MSIKFKLIISYFILIIFAVSVLGLLIGKKSRDSVFDEVTEKSQRISELINTTLSVRNDLLIEKSYSDLDTAKRILNSLGDLRVDNTERIQIQNFNLPTLYAGTQKLSLSTSFVDDIKESTYSLCSIFLLNNDKLIRVSSSLLENNQRPLGTYFSSDSDIYNKIINNEEYCGKATLEGETYISRIKPLLDKNGSIIGAVSVENPVLNSYLEKTLSAIKIGKTGYVYITDSKGKGVVHPTEKGNFISEYDFYKKITSTKNGTVEYTYKNVYKLACYIYFEPWDWYIVATANYDDLVSSSKSILYTTLFSALVIILLGGIIALFMTNTLVKPINKLKSYIEIAGKGDLAVRSDINSKDEIGILSDSFNNMIAENKRLLEEAVQYDKLKTEFIANMSHELRTPLNIIFCTAQLFSSCLNQFETSDSKKLINYTNTIKQNCYRLLRLVNNLIDITKIDSGFMELNLKNQNIVAVVEEITQSTAEYVHSKSRTIIFDTDIEEKNMAFDEEKMERILLNLISNATKFTRPGDEIEVGVYDRNNYIMISVKDSGVGIPRDKLPQIFQRFKQVDPLLSRRHEGSGIGLSLVKSLVEMHSGKITVTSEINYGTEFKIFLPVTETLDSNVEQKKDLLNESKVEKIHIEFSDIYS